MNNDIIFLIPFIICLILVCFIWCWNYCTKPTMSKDQRYLLDDETNLRNEIYCKGVLSIDEQTQMIFNQINN